MQWHGICVPWKRNLIVLGGLRVEFTKERHCMEQVYCLLTYPLQVRDIDMSNRSSHGELPGLLWTRSDNDAPCDLLHCQAEILVNLCAERSWGNTRFVTSAICQLLTVTELRMMSSFMRRNQKTVVKTSSCQTTTHTP
jgi:hypothetical protein